MILKLLYFQLIALFLLVHLALDMVEVFGTLADTSVEVSHLYLSLCDDLLGLSGLELLLFNLGGQSLHLDHLRLDLLAVLLDFVCLLLDNLAALGHLLL